MVSKVDHTVDFQDFHPTYDCRLLKKKSCNSRFMTKSRLSTPTLGSLRCRYSMFCKEIKPVEVKKIDGGRGKFDRMWPILNIGPVENSGNFQQRIRRRRAGMFGGSGARFGRERVFILVWINKTRGILGTLYPFEREGGEGYGLVSCS
jgi:hypothetical protein